MLAETMARLQQLTTEEETLEVSFLDYKGARARLSHPEPKALFNRTIHTPHSPTHPLTRPVSFVFARPLPRCCPSLLLG